MVEVQVQGEVGEAPWPFSCEFVVGRFSKLDGRARQGEGEALQEVPDPQVAPVAPAALHQEARGRHSEQDRVSYGRSDIRARLKKLGRGIPAGVKLAIRSVLGAQGKQGAQLAVKLLG